MIEIIDHMVECASFIPGNRHFGQVRFVLTIPPIGLANRRGRQIRIAIQDPDRVTVVNHFVEHAFITLWIELNDFQR